MKKYFILILSISFLLCSFNLAFAGPYRPESIILCDELKESYFYDYLDKKEKKIDLYNIDFTDLIETVYNNFDHKNHNVYEDYNVNNNNYQIVHFDSYEDDNSDYYLLSSSNIQQIKLRLDTLLDKCSFSLNEEEKDQILKKINQWVAWIEKEKYNGFGKDNSFFILPNTKNNLLSIDKGYKIKDQVYRFNADIVNELIVVYPKKMIYEPNGNNAFIFYGLIIVIMLVMFLGYELYLRK